MYDWIGLNGERILSSLPHEWNESLPAGDGVERVERERKRERESQPVWRI